MSELKQAPAIVDTACARILNHTGTHTQVSGDGTFHVVPAPRLRPVIHLDLGAKVRTTAVLVAGSSRPRRAGVFLSAIDGRTPSSEASSSPTRPA